MKKAIFILFFLLFTPFLANAEEQPQAMIVFDASGSMWGKINGKAKIGIAKQALNKVLSDWNEDLHLGLMAYGHRKKGDCSDIQTLVSIGSLDKDSMIAKIKAIKPKGKTPISLSLQKAAEELRYTEDKATIILISDGKETCDADPCATAKALNSEGIDFITHVIGFDVDKQTDKQLKCIADSTGGEYFSAKNASSLNEAMGKIAEKVNETPPKPEPPVIKKLKKNLEISASEKEGGKWIKAYHLVYKIVDGEAEGNKTTGCYSKKKALCLEKIAVGKYILHSTYNDFKQETNFEVKAGEATKLHIVMGQTGKTEITASEKEGSKWIKAYHTVYKIVDGEAEGNATVGCYSKKKKSCVEQIPVGKYTLRSTYNDFKQETSFEVKAGQTTKLHIVMGQTGKTEITASEKEGGKWIRAYHAVYKITDGEAEGNATVGCYSKKKKPCVEQIPVGKYTLRSTYNDFKQETNFEIKAGEASKVHVVMGQTGKIEITASEKEGGKWIQAYHSVYKIIDGEAEENRTTGCYSKKKKSCVEQIPVGKYKILSTFKSFKKDTPFEIKAGKTTKLHVLFSQFIIKSKCSNMGSKITHEIYASNGQLIFEKKSSCSKSVNAVLKDGSYTITSTVDNESKDTKLSVGADHPNQITIDMQKTNKEPSHQDLIDSDKQNQSSSENVEKTTPEQKKQVSETSKEDVLANKGTESEKKPLKDLQESIRASIPKYQSAIDCYEKSDALSAVKECETIEKEIMKQVQEKFQKVAGSKSNKGTEIKQHSEWNDEIKKQTVGQKKNDLKGMKLTLTCFDQGAGLSDLPSCIKKGGKHTSK